MTICELSQVMSGIIELTMIIHDIFCWNFNRTRRQGMLGRGGRSLVFHRVQTALLRSLLFGIVSCEQHGPHHALGLWPDTASGLIHGWCLVHESIIELIDICMYLLNVVEKWDWWFEKWILLMYLMYLMYCVCVAVFQLLALVSHLSKAEDIMSVFGSAGSQLSPGVVLSYPVKQFKRFCNAPEVVPLGYSQDIFGQWSCDPAKALAHFLHVLLGFY